MGADATLGEAWQTRRGCLQGIPGVIQKPAIQDRIQAWDALPAADHLHSLRDLKEGV